MNIPTGPIARPAVRTTIQAAIAEAGIRLVEVVPEPDLVINATDRALILVLAVGAVTAVQHAVERRSGKVLFGPATEGDA